MAARAMQEVASPYRPRSGIVRLFAVRFQEILCLEQLGDMALK